MKTMLRTVIVCLLACSCFAARAALQWSDVGLAGFSGPGTFRPKMVMAPGSIPYVVYDDDAAGDRATVKKFDGSDWVLVGNAGFSAGGLDKPDISIAPSGAVYVAYSDYAAGGRMTVMMFNGSAWTTVGTAGFTATSVEAKQLAFDASGTPFLVYKDDTYNAENIVVVKFDGAAWVPVGTTGIACNNTSDAAIVVDAAGYPCIAYTARGTNAYTNKVTVRKFDGASWNVLGGGPVSAGGSYSASLALSSTGELYVGYSDLFPLFLANVKRFDGTAWVSVGNTNFSDGAVYYMTMALDGNDVPYVVYSDEAHDYGVTVKKLDGTGWSTVGTENISDITGSFSSIGFDAANVPFVAYQLGAEANQEMAVKRYTTVPDYAVGTISGPFCPGSIISVPFTITNGSFNSNNVFTVQISDGRGSFANRDYIGTLAGTTSGVISAELPFYADDTGYRIRIISSSPNAVSVQNGTDITIKGVHNGIKTYTAFSEYWTDPENWIPCGMPDATDSVIISGADTVEIPYYFNASARSITLANGAVLKFRGGSFINMDGVSSIDTGTTLQLESGSSLNIGTGGALVINGLLDIGGYVGNSGRIAGTGTIIQNGYIDNRSGAHIAPGNSPGKLTLTGDLDLGVATLDIEVNGNTPATQYDVLDVSGDVNVGQATAVITKAPGYTLAANDVITFLRAGSITGTLTAAPPSGTALRYNQPAAGQLSLLPASPLPVRLLRFNATNTAAGPLLEWATEQEAEVAFFDVERSADGRSFAAVGRVNAAGSGSSYNWTDRQATALTNYYRLKVVDNNGSARYSQTVAVSGSRATAGASVQVSPCPASDFVTVACKDARLEGSPAMISDLRGKEQYRFTLEGTQVIPTAGWPSGCYVLQLANGEAVRILKR